VTEPQDPGFSFQDKRRIDPETGQVRGPGDAGAPAPTPGADQFDEIVQGLEVESDLQGVDTKVVELTADLQRVHAEYANYRKRVDRDRDTNRDLAVGSALAELLPVLDDIGRARDHGDLEGAFKSVAESLEATVARLGLERFATAGDPFDPTIHEAITHTLTPEVTGPTCVQVFQPGYRYKTRVLRPAIVAVADPE
jgi:molecular chaperone GrpE